MTHTFERIQLDNGLVVLLEDKPDYGSCVVNLCIKAGWFHDVGRETAHLLEHVIASAMETGERDPLRYGVRNAFTKQDTTEYFILHILPEDIVQAVDRLALAFTQPDTSILDREKEAAKEELLRKNDLLTRAQRRVYELAWPKHAALLFSERERIQTFPHTTQQDIRAFWENRYVPENAVFYVGGEITSIRDELLERLRKIPARKAKQQPVWPNEEPVLTENKHIQAETELNGCAKINFFYPFPPFEKSRNLRECLLLNALSIYCNGSHGPLYKRFREALGITYGASAGKESIGKAGFFYVSVPTSFSENGEQIEQEWRRILTEIAMNGFPNDELPIMHKAMRVNDAQTRRNITADHRFHKEIFEFDSEEASRIAYELTNRDIQSIAGRLGETPYVRADYFPISRR